MHDADKAIHNWTRVISLHPENIDAHSRLALVYERLGRSKQAITEHISVASLLQHEGKLEEAQATGEHALSLDPKNQDAILAVGLLNDFKSLPKPMRVSGETGPLKLPKEKKKSKAKKQALAFEDGPDPIEEANQKALSDLAGMLFKLAPEKDEDVKETGNLRNIARVVAEGLLTRGYDEEKITKSLTKTIELQRKGEPKKAAGELKKAIESGLDHPAAHFELGYLLSQFDRRESAQRSYQRAVKNTDYTLAARLQIADYLRDQGRMQEAASQYMQALRSADGAVVDEKNTIAVRQQYEPLIEAVSQNENDDDLEGISKNIRYLLMRPNWRMGVSEARAQLPRVRKGAVPAPLADILTQANSGQLVDAMARINRIANGGFPRAAIEETFIAMEFASNYLPLHINMGELMLMQDHPQQAIEKFSTIARLYSARGESDRATQMYQRIVDVSPLNTEARKHLISQVTASGNTEAAISQYLEMADVYYRLAQLDQARETYENALRMVQSTELEATWTAQILHKMADIDLQRLDWRNALRVYEQLRTLVPEDASARINLIQLNLRLGQKDKAGAELDNYLSYLNSRSQDKESGAFLQKLVEDNEDYVLGHRRLAEYFQQIGDRDNSIAEWNKVGEMLVEAGDREGAKVAVRAILSMDPPNSERYQEFLKKLN
jgi:tetratricopeptide (TPR) repeat protein